MFSRKSSTETHQCDAFYWLQKMRFTMTPPTLPPDVTTICNSKVVHVLN